MLTFYDHRKETRVTADASLQGLGAMMEQLSDSGDWRPVCFASRRLSETEGRYSNIEREALAVTWACERFREYLIGLKFTIQTDHRPLCTLLGKKPLEDLTARIQRLRMRMMQFDFEITYIPGKEMWTADALSRSPVEESSHEEILQDVNCFIDQVYQLAISDVRLRELLKAQEEDEVIKKVKELMINGWDELM